ncbi:hypothetical protein [Nostoc sp.]|uniref:hypothetical protein n=1 Tax=Nostoc sp. TaxID=1180 RepID=UPI002FFA8727
MNEPCLGCAYAARNQERRRRLPLSAPSTPSLREACLRQLRERQREVSRSRSVSDRRREEIRNIRDLAQLDKETV